MEVQCSQAKGCPIEGCPHRVAHSPSYTLALLALKPIEIETFCDDTERICGERYPKERIKVICQSVEGGEHQANVGAEQKEPIPV